jgi:hypothetical protein
MLVIVSDLWRVLVSRSIEPAVATIVGPYRKWGKPIESPNGKRVEPLSMKWAVECDGVKSGKAV